MEAADLARKLRIGPGAHVLVLNGPEDYAAKLGPLPDGARVTDSPDEGAAAADVVHLFVRNSEELARHLRTALEAAAPREDDALLWISYPKTGSGVETDITRDRGWEALRTAGWRPVAQVSVDEVWSALRFRPEGAVGG